MSLSPGVLRLTAGFLRSREAEFARAFHTYDWHKIARPEQLAPGEPGAALAVKNWRYWLIQAGRGWGKTKTGAETVRDQVRRGRRRNIALVAPTLNDGRRLMIEGDSGILKSTPKIERPVWKDRDRELHWPNGAVATLYTAEEPERLRGGNHDFAWCDEIGSWRYDELAWKMLRLATRITGPLGDPPQFVITFTPRPTPLVRHLVANPRAVITRGSTYDNQQNLADDFLEAIREEFEGTRLGQQEIEGDLLGDTPGAMFKMSQIDAARVFRVPFELMRVVVSVDPAVADAQERKIAEAKQTFLGETGIIVSGIGRCRCKEKEAIHGFVLSDLSGYYAPDEWARQVVAGFTTYNADKVIAEVNNGGSLVQYTLKAYGGGGANLPYKAVTASRGKQIRAEPIATIYERLEVHHVGKLSKLEDQMTTWNPLLSRKSPDRMDAAVWGLTELMLGNLPQSLGPSLPRVHQPRRL